MASNLWFFYALSCSVLWGMGYTLAEKMLRLGVPPSFLMLMQALICLPLYVVLSTKLGQFKSGFDFLYGNKTVILFILMNAACVVTGQFLILTSISEKNATLSSMVEITYPIFVALFSWVLFRQFHLSWTSGIGGLMIMGGVFLIYMKN